MDAVLDKALALRGVTGVLVLTRDSWLTIASRGALTANDTPAIERLLSWTEEDATGSVPWLGGEDGRCLHFHRADTHTLILLRQQHQQHRQRDRPRLNSIISDDSAGAGSARSYSYTHGLSLNLVPPRMRFGWSSASASASSTHSGLGSGAGAGARDTHTHTDNHNRFGLRAGTASLFAFPRSVDSSKHNNDNVHRPSSWY